MLHSNIDYDKVFSAKQAREFTDRLRSRSNLTHYNFMRAWDGQAHIGLGLRSWKDYCASELRIVPLSVERRRARVYALHNHGMPLSAIAAAVGVHHNTVRGDLATGSRSAVQKYSQN